MAQTAAQVSAPVTLDDLYRIFSEQARQQTEITRQHKEALEAETRQREADRKRHEEALEAEIRQREADRKRHEEALEADRKRHEEALEADRKRHEEALEAETRQREASSKDWEKRMKELGKNIGGMNNSLGEIVEHLVASGIITRFKELGYTFDKMSRNTLTIAPNGQKREVDVELHNGVDIMLIEIKAKPKEEDVDDHVERITFLRNLKKFPGQNVYGAIAGAVFSKSVKNYAIKKGLFVIEQSGDTMRIETLDGQFKPKKW
ncbi:hypothetical protein FACS1894124_2210 [Spirochaetia bacterium]|nr:hypothetical protein FACS1894124_2210 [Spirochaetia bacterium]